MERAEIMKVMTAKAVEMLEVDAEAMKDDSSFVDDLEVDSLSLVEYTMDLEDEFGIELPEDELTDLKTIGAFADLIHTKVLAKA